MSGQTGDPLEIVPVQSPDDLRAFIRVPAGLYSGRAGFSAPLEIERLESHDPKKNPFFEHARAQYWIARRGRETVGRISAQIDELAPRNGAGGVVGYFGFFDVPDDAEVAQALLRTAEDWLREHGAAVARGPISHSLNEEMGLLVDGFEARPMLMMPYHPPYAGPLAEAAGYAKAKDVHAYNYRVATEHRRFSERMAGRVDIQIRQLDNKRYAEDIKLVADIFNDGWANNWGFSPFTELEVAHLAKSLKPVLSPDLTLFAYVGDEPAAMVVCLPNVAEAARDLGGKLLPFGWAKLLWRLKVSGAKSCRVPLMGVRQSFQDTMVGAAAVRVLLEKLDEGMRSHGFEEAELSWILEDNRSMRGLLKSIGAEVYKTYRVYERPLNPV